jgi:phosphoglycolate phosphatase
MRHRFKAIVFDFDYTLADSSNGVVECIDFALRAMGLQPVPGEVACRTIGLSLPDTFAALVGQEYVGRADEFVHLFVQRADEVMADLTVLFEPVPETIEGLRGRGVPLGIVSTKFRYRIETILRRENLFDAFDVIIGGEDVSAHKPNPVALLAAVERLGSTPTSTVYVGDSVTDAETAKRAGVPFVAILSGTTTEAAFRDYPTCRVLRGLSELLTLEDCR